jgi:hypothetical protein
MINDKWGFKKKINDKWVSNRKAYWLHAHNCAYQTYQTGAQILSTKTEEVPAKLKCYYSTLLKNGVFIPAC